jgi:hypothetical protein
MLPALAPQATAPHVSAQPSLMDRIERGELGPSAKLAVAVGELAPYRDLLTRYPSFEQMRQDLGAQQHQAVETLLAKVSPVTLADVRQAQAEFLAANREPTFMQAEAKRDAAIDGLFQKLSKMNDRALWAQAGDVPLGQDGIRDLLSQLPQASDFELGRFLAALFRSGGAEAQAAWAPFEVSRLETLLNSRLAAGASGHGALWS